jgi:DNA phosphorothioation-associated putative methyltransferase
MHRRELSRPLQQAVRDGLLRSGWTIFDYGCGHGDDLRVLSERGYVCSGWDPVLRPNGTRTAADVVNLGYVVNVIEDPSERAEALIDAWTLSRELLVVAARVKQEEKLR